MARILVTPEQLQTIAAQFSQTVNDIQSLASRVQGAANSLDWELKQKAGIDQQIADLNGKSRQLSQQALDLSAYLKKKGQEFITADSQASTMFGNLGNQISNSFMTIFPNIGKAVWPFYTFLPVFPVWIFSWMSKFKRPPKPPEVQLPPGGLGTKKVPDIQVPVTTVGNNPNPIYEKWQKTSSGGEFPTYHDGTLHPGIDIAPKSGEDSTVHPIGPGVIIKVTPEIKIDPKTNKPLLDAQGNQIKDPYGNSVVIEHTLADGTKVYSRYAHLVSLPKTPPYEVTANSDIGTMGSTGNSTGPHLHLSIQHDFPSSEEFYGHKPGDLIDKNDPTSKTWGQVMEKNFIDPTSILDGTLDLQFQNPPVKSQST